MKKVQLKYLSLVIASLLCTSPLTSMADDTLSAKQQLEQLVNQSLEDLEKNSDTINQVAKDSLPKDPKVDEQTKTVSHSEQKEQKEQVSSAKSETTNNAQTLIQQSISKSIEEKKEKEAKALKELEQKKAQALEQKKNSENCTAFMTSKNAVCLELDLASQIVIEKFVNSTFGTYLDPKAIKEHIAESYAFVLRASPANLKLNDLTMMRMELAKGKEPYKLKRIEIKKIIALGDLKFKVLFNAKDKGLTELAFEDFVEPTGKGKDYALTIKLVKNDQVDLTKFTAKGKTKEHDLKYDKNLVLNPFGLWVEDFELTLAKGGK